MEKNLDECVCCIVNGKKLMVNRDGDVWRWYNVLRWKLVNKKGNKIQRFCYTDCNGRKYMVHRIIAYVFMGLDLDDQTCVVEHVDGVRNNNRLENLKLNFRINFRKRNQKYGKDNEENEE